MNAQQDSNEKIFLEISCIVRGDDYERENQGPVPHPSI